MWFWCGLNVSKHRYVCVVQLYSDCFPVLGGSNVCRMIANEAREVCSEHSVGSEWTQDACEVAGCCWQQQANSSVPSCFRKGLCLQLSEHVKLAELDIGRAVLYYCLLQQSQTSR